MLEHTDGLGADVVFDAAGAGAVVHQLVGCVRPGGHVQIVALHRKPLEVDVAAELHHTEATWCGTLGYQGEDYERSIELVNSGRLDLSPFITARITPDEIVDKGFDTLIDHNDTAVKILVRSAVD